MEANEQSYSVYAPSNFPSLAPVSASSRSCSSRPPLRGAAPQRGSGIFFLFVIALMVAGAGVAGMTYLSPRLEAKHSGTVTTNAVVAKGDDNKGGPSSVGTTASTGPTLKLDFKTDAPPSSVGTTPSTTPSTTSTPTTVKVDVPPPGSTVASANPDKNKPKRRVVKRVPPQAGNANAAANLPDSRMPTAKLPDNPYPDKQD